MKFLLGLFLLQTSLAFSCGNFDIRETNTKIRENPTLGTYFSSPKNQDSMGWCYSYSSADLLTAELGFRVSSLHMNSIFINASYRDPVRHDHLEKVRQDIGKFKEVYESGWLDYVIPDVLNNGWVCSERSIPYDLGHPDNVKKMLLELESLKDFENFFQSTDPSEALCKRVQEIVPLPIPQESLLTISRSLLHENLNSTFKRLVESLCKERVTPLPKLKVVVTKKNSGTEAEKRNIMDQIQNGLASGKPLELTYDLTPFVKSGGLHSSVIMASRLKNGSCEYLIRNSWGKGCGAYRPNIDCNSNEGSFWASENDLYSSMQSIKFLQR